MVNFQSEPSAPVQAPPPQPPPQRKTSSTVHLCAATYMDEEFRAHVLRDIYYPVHRALAPNPGADPIPVIQHALRSRSLLVVRAIVILVIGLIALAASPAAFAILAMILLFWQLIVSGIRLFAELAGGLRKNRQRDWANLLVRFLVITAFAIGGFVFGGALLALAMGGASGEGKYDPVTGELISDGSSSDGGAGLTGLWLALLIGVVIASEIRRAWLLKSMPGFVEPPVPAGSRLAFIAANRDPEVVNYSAAKTPFVGAGLEIETWQFALPLRRKKHGAEKHSTPWPHFDTVSLSKHVAESIASLAYDGDVSRRLPGLQLSDHVFVSGHDTVMPTFTIDQLRASGYPHQNLDQVLSDPTTPFRHYLRCQIVSWDGELVTTVFVHTALQGETLYMEFSSYVLPPTKAEYHEFGRDSLGRPAAMVAGAFKSLIRLPSVIGRSFVELVNVTREALGRGGSDQTPQWAVRGSDDFGARLSIRELGSDTGEHNYFQFRDSVKYIKILERQLLATVIEYLDDKIETAELNNRAETIINAGVVNYGSIQAGAVGQDASANVGAVGTGSEGTVNT